MRQESCQSSPKGAWLKAANGEVGGVLLPLPFALVRPALLPPLPQPLAAASPCFGGARARARRDRRICGLTAPVAAPVSCSSSAASAAANTAAAGDVASRLVLMRRGLRPRRQR